LWQGLVINTPAVLPVTTAGVAQVHEKSQEFGGLNPLAIEPSLTRLRYVVLASVLERVCLIALTD
jgi:hypothetical protein